MTGPLAETPSDIRTADFPVETFNPENFLEERVVTPKGGQPTTFRFLVVDDPQKWEEAAALFCNYDMPVVGTYPPEVMRFPLSGISMKVWEATEIANPVPEWDGADGDVTKDFKKEQDRIAREKNVEIFERSLGKKIPGVNAAEKVRWLNDRSPGEADALLLFVTNQACNLQDGQQMMSYNLLSRTCEQVVTMIDDFEKWTKAVESKYVFRMQRPFQDYILEFPMRGIDETRRLEIEEETKRPHPPIVPKRDSKGRFDPTQMVPDYNDHTWLQQSRAVTQKRTVMFFESCLTFSIPGIDVKQKYDWISKRLVGDVVRVRRFIEDSLLSYKARYDVFTTG